MPTLYWERLLSYHSTQIIQKKLEKCYQKLEHENSSALSYDNCYRFIYFLKHGENFFLQANQSPHAIQPILLFYGISQLLKACLIIKDPNYPSTSS
ncbi:MAG TPA: YaaC family protein, partial [Metabacillus sp.]|nr:YaaC family protein [Metabacillus sp.]